MRLLVSVASAAEASAALAGGAEFIDAKNPQMGALGAVSEEVLRDIYRAVAGVRPVTAALGDAADEAKIEEAARRREDAVAVPEDLGELAGNETHPGEAAALVPQRAPEVVGDLERTEKTDLHVAPMFGPKAWSRPTQTRSTPSGP